MATFYKRKSKDGSRILGWKAVVRIKGYPTVCKLGDRKQELIDWAQEVEQKIRDGKFNFQRLKKQHTFADLVDRYKASGALEDHKAAKDTIRHLEYWKTRFKSYRLVHLSPELIAKERQHLLNTPSVRDKARGPATVNRYIAALSSVFSYACRELRWIDENPCFNLIKLKEPPGRNRVLTVDEMGKLLEESKKSKSPYLLPIILLAMTTGMRRGEIVNLDWPDVDLEKGVAHLRDTKNGTPRSVPLAQPVIEELEKIYKNRNPAKNKVFASRTTFGTIDIKKAWYSVLKKTQILDFTFHDLRHTFATLATELGASHLELATAMGHKTLQMLLRYTHMQAEKTRKYSDVIGQKAMGSMA